MDLVEIEAVQVREEQVQAGGQAGARGVARDDDIARRDSGMERAGRRGDESQVRCECVEEGGRERVLRRKAVADAEAAAAGGFGEC